MPITQQQATDAIGATLYGSDGDKIGKVGQVYLDDQTGTPDWATVSTGMFGGSESFVPLMQAELSGDRLTVPFDKDKVKNAPRVDVDQHLSEEEESELYRYYGLDYSGSGDDVQSGTETRTTGTDYSADADAAAAGTYIGSAQGTDTTGEYASSDRGTTRGVGSDTSGPNTDDAMTRSEERLRVGTERREAGRARLRKYITEENVSQTVPVSHEEVRIEREPITDANRGDALSGGDLTEEEHEVTLHEERPVVQKETVPVERVRLATETVQEQVTVNETVRKENIEQVGGDTTTNDR